MNTAFLIVALCFAFLMGAYVQDNKRGDTADTWIILAFVALVISLAVGLTLFFSQ